MAKDLDAELAAVDKSGPYYYHFGQFIQLFSMVESQFHYFFDHISGLKQPLARSIMGGEQLKKVSSVCNHIVQHGDWQKKNKSDFQRLIDQLNAIAELRHILVHRGVQNITGELKSTNRLSAKSAENIELLQFNLGHIKEAIHDLRQMVLAITVIQLDEMREHLGEDVLRILDQPWQYIRIAPDKPNQPHHKGGQSQLRQQRSSRG